jgi:hypothetical protein
MQVIEILLYIFNSFSIDVISYSLVDLDKQQANLTAVSVISINVGEWYRYLFNFNDYYSEYEC